MTGPSTSRRVAALPFIWNSASTVLTLVAGIAASLLTARYLGPEGFGIFGLVQWTRVTSAMLLDIGFSSATTKFTAEAAGEAEGQTAQQMRRALFWIQVIVAAPAAAAVGLLAPTIAALLGQGAISAYLPIAAITLGITLVNGVLMAGIVGQQRFGLKVMLDAAVAAATLAGVVVAVVANLGLRGLLWTEVLVGAAQLVVLCSASRTVLLRRPTLRVPDRIAGRVLRYATGVFLLTAFDAVVWQRSEVLFLALFRGPEEIGYFTLAYGLAVTSLTLLPHSVGVVLFPSLSARYGMNDRAGLESLYRISTRHTAIIVFPLCVGGLVLAPEIIRVVYGPVFDSASAVLRVLFVGAAVGALATPGSGLLLALDRAGTRSVLAVPMMALNLVLALLLVPPFGAIGAAFAKSATQVIHVGVDVSYLAVRERFCVDWSGLGRIAVASIAPAAAAYVVGYVAHGLVGLLVAVIFGALAYLAALVITRAVPDTDLNQMTQALGASWLLPITRRVHANSSHQ